MTSEILFVETNKYYFLSELKEILGRWCSLELKNNIKN